MKLVFLKLLSDRRIRDKYSDLVWQERFDVERRDVRFSVEWIKTREIDTSNPLDSIQFTNLVHDIELEIQSGKRKRIFSRDDHIRLNPETVKSVVAKLQSVFLFGIDLDLNGRLFETFLSATMRGKDLGQFFTPRSIVKLGTKLGAPYVGKDRIDVVLDGCCGTGGFLIDALAEMWGNIAENKTLSKADAECLRSKVAKKSLFGVDSGRDPNLARLTRMNMYLHGDGGSSIFEADFLDKSLTLPESADVELSGDVKQLRDIILNAPKGVFDLVLTNPPFAKEYERINEVQDTILEKYDLAKNENRLRSSVMFFERYHDVLRPGGRIVSVIDDGLLSGRKYIGFRKFVRSKYLIRGIISLPGDAFQRSQARVKTSLIVLEKRGVDEAQVQDQGPVFMYACRFVGIDDPKRQRVLPIDRINRKEANREIAQVASLFAAFLRGDGSVAEWSVPADKVKDRLDVKSCFAKTARMVPVWTEQQITTAPLENLIEEVKFEEDDMIVTEHSAEEVTYLVVGYDGFARAGETIQASDHKSSKRVYRVHTNQIVVSHINAVHGSICVVPEELDGCVVTNECTAFNPIGNLDSRVIWAIMRSPEIRSEFLMRASGVGRTRVDWDTIRHVIVPVPPETVAKEIRDAFTSAEEDIRQAEQTRLAARERIDELYGLASDQAVATLQQFKPPK